MKFKKIINAFLILVLVLQLLPVKQVIRYFFNDNAATEEVTDINKGATKNFKLLGEDDRWINDASFHLHFAALHNTSFHSFNERVPAQYSAEVQTPPPDNL